MKTPSGKTKVKLSKAHDKYKEWDKDEIGYIDGYLTGADGAPCAAVVLSKVVLSDDPDDFTETLQCRIVMVPTHFLEPIVR